MARILIADDDRYVLTMLRTTLEDAGHEVTEAVDGAEALACFARDPADVVILDILMPAKQGIETLIELRRQYGDVPVIAMSGGGPHAAESYLDIARKFGAQRAFAKPIAHGALLEAIEEVSA
jgi:CheY-like chemotaxis protein